MGAIRQDGARLALGNTLDETVSAAADGRTATDIGQRSAAGAIQSSAYPVWETTDGALEFPFSAKAVGVGYVIGWGRRWYWIGWLAQGCFPCIERIIQGRII